MRLTPSSSPRRLRRALALLAIGAGLVGCSAQQATAPPPVVSAVARPSATAAPPTATVAPATETPPTATATATPAPLAASSPLTSTAALAPIRPLGDTTIVDRPLRNVRALTDGTTKYRLALWSPAGPWIAATPQDGPGLDAINSVTGEVVAVVTDTYVLEPVWDAAAASDAACLLVQRIIAGQDQLDRFCLPERTFRPDPAVSAVPIRTAALAGEQIVYSADGQIVWGAARPDSQPQPLLAGEALALALTADAEPRLAWTPLVGNLEQVQTLIAALDAPAPYAISTPDEGLWLPRWSRDGQRLVLSSIAARLVTATASGDQRYDLGPGDLPAWSPDGTRIAYAGANAGTEFLSRDIHLVDWRGDGPRLRLTRADEVQLFTSPSWSPDGARLAFVEIDRGQILIGDVP